MVTAIGRVDAIGFAALRRLCWRRSLVGDPGAEGLALSARQAVMLRALGAHQAAVRTRAAFHPRCPAKSLDAGPGDCEGVHVGGKCHCGEEEEGEDGHVQGKLHSCCRLCPVSELGFPTGEREVELYTSYCLGCW